MTNQTIRIPIGQSVLGVVNTDTGVTSINLRLSSGGGAVYNGTHVGDGVYEFTGVASGSYKVFSSSTELTKISWVLVGESGAVLITGDQTVAGIKTFSAQAIFSSGLATDTIAEKTSGSGVTIDGVLIKDSLNGSGIVALAGAQDISGLKSFVTDRPEVDSGVAPTANDQLVDKLYVDTADTLALHKAGAETVTGAKLMQANLVIDTANLGGLLQSAYVAPPSDTYYTPKKYVDDSVASIIASPYQEASNHVRVITNGTTETGKVYTSVGGASSYLGTPTATNPGFISLIKGNTSTGVFYITGSTTIKDYLTITGKGLRHWVCLSDTNTSLTKNVEFQNMSLFFGVNDIPGARSYNSFTFRNCIIYAYNNTTFTACKFYNTLVIHAATKAASLASCITWDSHFNQFLASDTGVLGTYTEGFDTGTTYYALPTDPSLTP